MGNLLVKAVERIKKSNRFPGLVLALAGVMKLLHELGKPRVEALRGGDVLGLVASGMLLGVGFIALIGGLNFKETSKDK